MAIKTKRKIVKRVKRRKKRATTAKAVEKERLATRLRYLEEEKAYKERGDYLRDLDKRNRELKLLETVKDDKVKEIKHTINVDKDIITPVLEKILKKDKIEIKDIEGDIKRIVDDEIKAFKKLTKENLNIKSIKDYTAKDFVKAASYIENDLIGDDILGENNEISMKEVTAAYNELKNLAYEAERGHVSSKVVDRINDIAESVKKHYEKEEGNEMKHQFEKDTESLNPAISRSNSGIESLNPAVSRSTSGAGKKKDEGMWDDQIEQAMKDDKNFQGAISADQMSKIKPAKKLSFIMNTDKASGPGLHWFAVRIDATKDKEVDIFDPLGDPPTEEFLEDLKKLVDKINPTTYLKLKINRVPNQRDDTQSCGYQSINFLKKIEKMPFAKATGYKEIKQNNTKQGEEQSKKLKKQLGFGYI